MDHDYLLYLIGSYESDELFNPLRTYLFTNSMVKKRHIHHLTKAELAELFLLNLSFCCLSIKTTQKNVSEAAIDALCVSSMIQYPPSEGGPLSYFVRNGCSGCTLKFKRLYTSINPSLLNQFETVTAVETVLFDKVLCKNDTFVSPMIDFHKMQSEGIFLTASELRTIGPSRGIVNKEVFLFIFSFNIMLLVIIVIFFLVFFSCFLVYYSCW